MIQFENDFQQKIMYATFDAGATLSTAAEVKSLRMKWMQELKSWHSPYKALIDATHLTIAAQPDVKSELGLMFKFLEGLFLRKAVVFGISVEKGAGQLSLPVFGTKEEALAEIGIRDSRTAGPAKDFRAAIQIQNHFQQHTMEISFSEPVSMTSSEQVQVLKSKITNALMQWHSKWNLLMDCTNLTTDTAVAEDIKKMLRFFEGFFLKNAVGYGKLDAGVPFPCFRSRHKAVAQLEAEGYFSGDSAHCKSGTKR